jgi:cobalamin synthase
MLAAILGKFIGGYHGPVFMLLTVVSAGVAVAAATASGRWWVVSALPPVAWLVASVAELAWHNPPYPDTKAKAVGLVHATTNVFPVILAALVVMGLVIAVAVARGRQSGGGTRRV